MARARAPSSVGPAGLEHAARLEGATFAAALFVAGAVTASAVRIGASAGTADITTLFLLQDAPALAIGGGFALWLRLFFARSAAAAAPASANMHRGFPIVLAVALLAAAAAFLGARFLYLGYALSTDEFMATFDAAIFRHGKLLAPVDPAWRAYVPALQPMFGLPVPGGLAWASSYLPMNAAIQAAFGLVSPALASATLAAVALMALFAIARQIWPERPDAAVIAVLLLASSSQFLITAMTPYAMTAHLALNLVWLWLFGRDTRLSHAAAIALGFVACGLHQAVFHPLFVTPFILSLWTARRWRLGALYGASYALIGCFWLTYPVILLASIGGVNQQPGAIEGQIGRILALIALDASAFGLMTRNVLRFAAWQNPLAIVLAGTALFAVRTWPRSLRDVALGIALTSSVMLLLMPFQGHGWGYRYLHGLLGSLSLLAAQGWIRVTEAPQIGPARARAAVAVGLIVSLGLLLPIRAWQVRASVEPYAAATDTIKAAQAEVVIVDPTGIWYGVDLVRNDPFLRASPKVVLLNYLEDAQIEALCARHSVALFELGDAAALGMQLVDEPSSRNARRRDLLRSLGCGRPVSVRK